MLLLREQLRVHRSVRALEAAIRAFIDTYCADGMPFAWTKTADEILAGIGRFARLTLTSVPTR